MNAIKRFINLLKSPLMPTRLFAAGDDDFDFSWTDEPAGYYDSDGNYLGDDAAAAEAAAESHDDPSLNPDNWEENSDDFGNVSIQTDGNGNITGTSYRDPSTGEWKDSGLSGSQEYGGHTSKGQSAQAVQVFGASMTPETLAALGGNKDNVSGLLEAGASGDKTSVAQLTALTGTMPDADSLKGLGYSDEQISTLNEFMDEYYAALRDVENPKTPAEAWKVANEKTGYPYGDMKGGMVTTDSETWRQYYESASRNNPAKGAKGTTEGTTKTNEPDKTASTPKTSEPKHEPATTPKSDPTFNNPFGKDDTPISVPKGPLEGTPLSGTGLPGHESEPTKENAEGRGFENDDSGSDTMEETSQDAPTSGLGGDTFANPNDDTERKGWGLGEEDPNRANYDVDKWNRGMERVSTDVVSDEKCKAFIKKTFRDDPVLIKTVKIMKTLK